MLRNTLHNFGLEASLLRDGTPYMDPTSVMGDGNVCQSAPEGARLGWVQPAELRSSSLPPAVWREYMVGRPGIVHTKTMVQQYAFGHAATVQTF